MIIDADMDAFATFDRARPCGALSPMQQSFPVPHFLTTDSGLEPFHAFQPTNIFSPRPSDTHGGLSVYVLPRAVFHDPVEDFTDDFYQRYNLVNVGLTLRELRILQTKFPSRGAGRFSTEHTCLMSHATGKDEDGNPSATRDFDMSWSTARQVASRMQAVLAYRTSLSNLAFIMPNLAAAGEVNLLMDDLYPYTDRPLTKPRIPLTDMGWLSPDAAARDLPVLIELVDAPALGVWLTANGAV